MLAVGGVSFPQKLGEEDERQRSEEGNDLKENTGQGTSSPSWPAPPPRAHQTACSRPGTQGSSPGPPAQGGRSRHRGRRAGGQLTHKHAAGGEVFRLHVRVPVEPQLLGLDPPLEGREQLGHPEEEAGKIDRPPGGRAALTKCGRPGTPGNMDRSLQEGHKEQDPHAQLGSQGRRPHPATSAARGSDADVAPARRGSARWGPAPPSELRGDCARGASGKQEIQSSFAAF